ncbi:hypothetical protein [Campylobacter fetus]|uniref:hypothetical protein n=1 Tax=Campylobacter fetus TaxID=196 RepID=UPI00168CBDC9|nr:hypothetical protein [Campylobacter fetus]MBD3865186.1 hypothetical protein [Campylobacter fetus]
MDYDNMTTEELEKEFQKAKFEESKSKEEVENGLLLETQKEKINSEDDSEDNVSRDSSLDTNTENNINDNDDSIEYEKDSDNTTEEPLVTQNGEVTQESVKSDLYTIKANGKEYDMSIDELKQMASKGMDYVKKTTALKPYRTMIAAMQENNISPEDLNMLIDLKKGNKEAISKLIKDNNVDTYDLPEGDNYKPTEYRKSEESYEINEIIKTISEDSEFSRTSNIYSKLDENSKQVISSNPTMLSGLHQDVKSGLFDKVLPYAEKRAMIDGFSQPFLKYYIEAGSEYLKNNTPKPNPIKSQSSPTNKDNKIAAALPSSRADKKSAIDYLDEEINDEDYYAWRKKLQRVY